MDEFKILTEKKEGDYSKYIIGAIAVLAIIMLFNQFQLLSIRSGNSGGITGGVVSGSGNSVQEASVSGDLVQEALAKVIPTGTPDYGKELGVSYDDPVRSLDILAGLESSISFDSLSSSQQQRYNKIATTQGTACEYCCGLKTSFGRVVDGKGQLACGCEHNQAFSGLTKWLLQNKEKSYNDAKILEEIQKWKALFFPQQTVTKYLQQQVSSGKADSSVLAGLPKMVGGC